MLRPKLDDKLRKQFALVMAASLLGLVIGAGQVLAADTEPSEVKVYLKQGLEAFSKGRYKEAAEAYEKAAALDPTNPVPYKNLGIAYIFMKHYRDAIDPFEKAVALRPTSADYQYNLARSYQLAKNYPKAVEIFQKTVELDNKNAKAFMRLGELYGREQERLPKSIEMLQKSIALEPNLSEAHYSLAVAYFGAKNYAEAWKSLKEAQRLKYPHIKPEFIKALRKVAPEQ